MAKQAEWVEFLDELRGLTLEQLHITARAVAQTKPVRILPVAAGPVLTRDRDIRHLALDSIDLGSQYARLLGFDLLDRRDQSRCGCVLSTKHCSVSL